jgi:hypothetical protein
LCGLGGGGPEKLLTPGCRALCPTTADNLADSDIGESAYRPFDRTPLGDGTDPCGGCRYGNPAGHILGGGSPGKLSTPRHGAPCSTTTEDLADSDNAESIYQFMDRTLGGDYAEPHGGCWYGVAGCSRGRSRPGSLCTPGHAASHSSTNKDLTDSDDGKSRGHSSDKTPRGDGAEPHGGCRCGVSVGRGCGGSWPGRLSTAGRRATYSTTNKDSASSTEDDGDNNSTGSQGLEDGNDLGSSGDGAALRCLGDAVLGSLAANIDQDKKDILEGIWPGSHNVHLLTHFARCHFAGDWTAYLLFPRWAKARSLTVSGALVWLDKWLEEEEDKVNENGGGAGVRVGGSCCRGLVEGNMLNMCNKTCSAPLSHLGSYIHGNKA